MKLARRVLDDELGRRLALAAAGRRAWSCRNRSLALADGDPRVADSVNVRRKLDLARERFDVRRVTLVSPELIALARTATVGWPRALRPTSSEPIDWNWRGPLLAIRRRRRLSSGTTASTYKRGYAAVGDPSPSQVAGFAVVEASADYFVPLRAFRRQLILGGIAALAMVMAVTVAMARRVSGPVVRLAASAERIGRGELDVPVEVTTHDEVGFLARTLDDMRTALKARDERLQMMLAGIAHEVRNPLGGLELYVGLLRDALAEQAGLPDRAERLEEIGRIDREVQYLKLVTSEFLDYARRAPPDFTSVAVADLFAEIRQLALTPGVTIEIAAAPTLAVRADPAQLRRALLNLARNAVAAVTRAHPGGGGRVRLCAEPDQDPGAVALAIEDNGGGVEPALRDKIFAPFFTTREKGTGLGLAFVREIVLDHGGEVRVDDAKGGGARFSFALPVARRATGSTRGGGAGPRQQGQNHDMSQTLPLLRRPVPGT